MRKWIVTTWIYYPDYCTLQSSPCLESQCIIFVAPPLSLCQENVSNAVLELTIYLKITWDFWPLSCLSIQRGITGTDNHVQLLIIILQVEPYVISRADALQTTGRSAHEAWSGFLLLCWLVLVFCFILFCFFFGLWFGSIAILDETSLFFGK